MPSNGLIFQADEYRIFAQSAASGQNHTDSGTTAGSTPVYGHSGTLNTYYTPDSILVDGGFNFDLSGVSNTNTWTVNYQGPGAPLGITWTGTGYTPVSVLVILTDLKVYHQGGTFRLVAGYEIIAQGVSRLTGSLDTTSGGLGPAYVPGIGIPARLSGGASASTITAPGTTDFDDIYAYMTETTGTVTGGWVFDQGDGLTGLPMLISGTPPGAVGSCTDPGVASVSADDTGTVEIVSYARNQAANTLHASGTITACCTVTECPGQDPVTNCADNDADWQQYELDTQSFGRGGSVYCVPDLDRAIIRINEDFAALFYRGEMPETRESKSASCNFNGVVTTSSSTPTVHPNQAEILLEVDETVSAMEDTLADYHALAPWSTSGSWSRSKTYTTTESVIDCPNAEICDDDGGNSYSYLVGGPTYPDNESYSSSRSYSFPSFVGSDVIGYLGHAQAMPRYINSWCNPLWSYLLWNEPWELEGGPTNWADYWEKIGSQYLYNSSLSDPSLRRNHLVSEALVQDLNQPFLDTFVAGQRWIGQSRWKTVEVTPRTTYTFTSASSSLWSAKDSAGDALTLSHGSDVDVSESATVKMRLGSWSVEPYMWSHIANEFVLNWTGDVSVYLEDQWGKRVLLATTPGTHDIVTDLSSRYAGTWAQDYGCGLIDDIGVDTATQGRSLATCGDAESLFAPMISSAYGYKYLVFVTDGAASIDYPTLNYNLSGSRLHVKENSLQDNVIHPEGPIVRFGTWNTGSGGTIDIPPMPAGVDLRPDLIDWLTQYRFCVQGINETDTAFGSVPVTTMLTQLFDTYEGQSVGGTRNGAYAYWLPSTDWRIAIINSIAEIPPLGILPHKERNADWDESGDYVQYTYIWAQDTHYALSTANTVELRTDDGVTAWFDTGTEIVADWWKYEWDNSLTNDEFDFEVWDTKRKAKLRPWRGFCYFPAGNGSRHGVAATRTRDHVHVYAKAVSDTITVYRHDEDDNLLSSYTFAGSEVALTKLEDGQVIAAVVTNDTLITIYKGETTLTTITTSDGVTPAIASGSDGHLRVYWVEGDTVYHARYDSAGNVMQARIATTGIGAIDDNGIGGVIVTESYGKLSTRLAVIQSGSLNVYASVDGIAFS